jgi:copper chaperone
MCNTDDTCTIDNTVRDLGLKGTNHTCNCGNDNQAAAVAHLSDNAIRDHYFVEGMTCSHCVASVTEEVSALAGVDSVSVELHAGGASKIMVVSSMPIDADFIRAAVTEAGYSLVAG